MGAIPHNSVPLVSLASPSPPKQLITLVNRFLDSEEVEEEEKVKNVKVFSLSFIQFLLWEEKGPCPVSGHSMDSFHRAH